MHRGPHVIPYVAWVPRLVTGHTHLDEPQPVRDVALRAQLVARLQIHRRQPARHLLLHRRRQVTEQRNSLDQVGREVRRQLS